VPWLTDAARGVSKFLKHGYHALKKSFAPQDAETQTHCLRRCLVTKKSTGKRITGNLRIRIPQKKEERKPLQPKFCIANCKICPYCQS
jgi:hypothetical protein